MTEEHKYAREWRQAVVRRAGFKGRLRYYVRHAILSSLSKLSSAKMHNCLLCLYCHYVFDDQKDKFSKIIRSLKKNGSFVNTATCIAMLEGSIPINGRYFHLSFDDGFPNIF